MANYTRQQVEELLKNKPPGVSDKAVLQALVRSGNQVEGLSLPSQQKKTNTAVQRVGGVINETGQTITEQIQGTGEYAGQSAVRRGTGAVSEAFGAVPSVAIAAAPEQVQQGIQKVAEPIMKGFSWLTDKIGSNKKLQDFVMNNPDAAKTIEEIAGTAANVGNIADVTLGAKGVERGIVRTSEATVDVGREALDRTLRATDKVVDVATPSSVRTLLRGSTPETKTAAVNQLEDAYKSALVQDRKAINNKLDRLAAANSFGDTVITRDSLIRDLAEEGYIPKIDGQFAKFDDVFDDIKQRQTDLMNNLDNELAPLQGIETQTSLDRMRQQAEATLRQSPQIGAGLNSSITELNRMFDSFAEKFGNNVSPVEVNNIRKEMNRVTRAYKEKGGEAIFQLDTAEAVAKTARQRLDEVVPSGKVRQLNQEWARLERVGETARVLNNEIVEVGLIGRKLGSYVGTIGASLAGLSLAGPGGLVVASIFAQLGSDALATLLRARKFSPELRDAIIKNLKDDPTTVERLIREASPENKAFLRNMLLGGGAIAGAEYFLDEGETAGAAAVLIGSTGGKTPITGKALDRIEEYIDWSSGIKKVKGQELIDLKADAQMIAERAGIKATGGDKQLGNALRSALDEQNFVKKGQPATAKTTVTPTNLLEEAKGKSLEEFIESQGKTVHHATDSGVFDPADFDVTKAAKGEQYFNPLGQGMYVSSNPDFVKRFGKNRMELVLPANAKIKTITQDEWLSGYGMDLVNEAFEEMGGMPSSISQTELDRVVRNAPIDALNQVDSLISQKEGLEVADKFVEALNKVQTKRNSQFDAIVYEATDYAFDADEIVIPDPSILKTRAQLEDIWKQANKADTPNANLLEEAKGKSLKEFERELMNNSNISKNPRFQEIDIRRVVGTDYPELDDALRSGKKMTVDEIEQIIQPTDEFIDGQPVVWPIEVSKNADGTYQLYAGNHRLAQKLINGDFKILANVTNDKSGKTIKEIWEEANKADTPNA